MNADLNIRGQTGQLGKDLVAQYSVMRSVLASAKLSQHDDVAVLPKGP